MTDGRSFARNSIFNLVGLVIPLGVAVVAMPPLVRGLGMERFGILSLAWATIGYFGLFELGLSRALTQAAAARLGSGRSEDLASLTWTTFFMLFGLGVLGAAAVAGTAPVLVQRFLNVPVQLQRETITSFSVLALSLPLVVSSAGLRGLMEAHQDFGAVNALRIPLTAFTFIGPLLALPFSRSLVAAVAILAIVRAIGWAAHLAFCLRRYRYLRHSSRQATPMAPLLKYGGWTTVTNLVSPVMMYVDRFVIATVLPLGAVAQYVTPFEAVTKVTVVPAAIVSAMFPTFAATFASQPERIGHLYDRSIRAIVLALFPIVLLTVVFAHEALSVWMGTILPAESVAVLRWLAVGVFINAVAHVPYAALQGAGRPDVVAKLHLVEVPLYALLLWTLIHTRGLEGVAMAWTGRVAIDAVALLVAGRWYLSGQLLPGKGGVWSMLSMLAAIAIGGLPGSPVGRAVYALAILCLFWLIGARSLLPAHERVALRQWLRREEPSPLSTSESVA